MGKQGKILSFLCYFSLLCLKSAWSGFIKLGTSLRNPSFPGSAWEWTLQGSALLDWMQSIPIFVSYQAQPGN